jgi:hypothetical protein
LPWMQSLSVIVDDLNVPGVPVSELESNPP